MNFCPNDNTNLIGIGRIAIGTVGDVFFGLVDDGKAMSAATGQKCVRKVRAWVRGRVRDGRLSRDTLCLNLAGEEAVGRVDDRARQRHGEGDVVVLSLMRRRRLTRDDVGDVGDAIVVKGEAVVELDRDRLPQQQEVVGVAERPEIIGCRFKS